MELPPGKFLPRSPEPHHLQTLISRAEKMGIVFLGWVQMMKKKVLINLEKEGGEGRSWTDGLGRRDKLLLDNKL